MSHTQDFAIAHLFPRHRHNKTAAKIALNTSMTLFCGLPAQHFFYQLRSFIIIYFSEEIFDSFLEICERFKKCIF